MVSLKHVAIRARDLTRSREFYEQGIGLRFVGLRASGVSMDLTDGSLNVTLLPYSGPPRQALAEGSEFIHLGFLTNDLGAIYQRLRAIGVEIARDDINERRDYDPAAPPTRSFKVLDPDGNVLDISGPDNEWRIDPQKT